MATASSPPTSQSASRYLTPKPTAIAQGKPHIDHPQLRDLLICRHERGLVTYLAEDDRIVEQNLLAPGAPTRTLASPSFTPSSLTGLALGPNDEDTLIAAGGSWEAELHLSYHQGNKTALWERDVKLQGALNNSVLLTKHHYGGVEPRVGVTNNDRTFRMYDCAVRTSGQPEPPEEEEDDSDDPDTERRPPRPPPLKCVGGLTLDACVNYAAISPSGRTLLNVGDSPNLYLHDISGSARLSFYPICVLPIPVPTNTPPHYPVERPSTFTASFSASFSADSMHLAVGSQEGVVAIWDLRHASRPITTWQVDKMRAMGTGGMGAAPNGVISWDPSDWFHSRAPAWSVRNVKFIGGNRADGKEYLVFTEHTSLMHIVNAKTLELEETIKVPARMMDPQPPTPPIYSLETPRSPLSYIQLGMPPSALAAGPADFARIGNHARASFDWDEDSWGLSPNESFEVESNQMAQNDEDDMKMDVESGPPLLLPKSLLLNPLDPDTPRPSPLESEDDIPTPIAHLVDIPSNTLPRFSRSPRTLRHWDSSLAGLPATSTGLTQLLSMARDLPSTSALPHSRHVSVSSQATFAGSGGEVPRSPSPLQHQGREPPVARRRGKTAYKSSAYMNRTPKYIVSDGYVFPSETAELEYLPVDDENPDAVEENLAQGLDIAGMCADPSGRWLYVATEKGVVEWGLV